jgi:hypothetical protein
MQAILLVEIFSTYKSRRPSLQLSKSFQDSYCTLARDHELETTSELFTYCENLDLQRRILTASLKCESKQRLLAAYYILDQEQAALFGRHKTDPPDFMPANLSYPQPLRIWDSDVTYKPSLNNHAGGWYYESRGSLGQPVVPSSHPRPSAAAFSDDIFTTTLTLIFSNSTNSTSPSNPQINRFPSPQTSPHLALIHTTLSLTTHTPIRSLLATAGESWIMASKLPTHSAYTSACEAVQQWTTTPSASKALTLALEIFRLHRRHPRIPCFYHEWTLHLASLVMWASGYAKQRGLRVEIPSQGE